MKITTNKISIIEKVGYSLGDLAANLIFQTLMIFLTFFYTDIYKIPPGKASVIIFAGGMIGAFFNPVMGVIADRTNTKWGKFRPWILWTAIPFGVIAMLAFRTPDFNINGKITYALITYILLVIVYSANNLPYASLSGVLTGDMAERNSISSYRFVAVMIAQFIVQSLLPLILFIGKGDRMIEFEKIMTVFAVAGVIFFLISFLLTRERIIPKPEKKSSMKEDMLDLLKNTPLKALMVITIFIFITLALKGGIYVYYFEDYLNEKCLAEFLENLGFNDFFLDLNNMIAAIGFEGITWPDDAPAAGFSVFNAMGIVMMILGIAFSKTFADKFGKRDVFGISLLLSALCLLMFYFYSPESIELVFITQIIHSFFYGITIPILWAMIADVADYSEWKNNRRATAITFSAIIFGLQVGLIIGWALVGGILATYGYNENMLVQSSKTIQGIKITMSVLPALTFFIGIACLFFYEINKKMELKIQNDLMTRRL